MNTCETYSTEVELTAAYLLAKGLKMVRLEIVPKEYYLDNSFHFPKEEAEALLNSHDRMINFIELKLEHDLLCGEARKARERFRKEQGGNL